MRTIYIIIITTLALAFTANSARGQKPSDSLRLIYKNKTVVVKPQGEESSTTVRFNDTALDRKVIIHVYFVENDKEVGSSEGFDTISKKIYNTIKDKTEPKKRTRFIETSFLPTIDIGLASTMNDMETPRTYTPKLGKSVNIGLGLIRQDMNLYNDQILLSYGLSYNYYYLKYSDKQMVQYIDDKGYLNSRRDSVNHYNKNRLDISYLAVPVMLEYHGKKDKFNIGAGVEFGFNGHSKVTLKGETAQSQDFKQKNEVDIKVSPTQMNAILRIGFSNIAVYAKYSITPMHKSSAFEQGNDPGQHLYAVGVCLFGI